MSRVITKLELGRICLWSFILLSSIFMSENTFSRPWQKNMNVDYKLKERTVTFVFLYYDYKESTQVHSYLSMCCLKYSTDGVNYDKLLLTSVYLQKSNDIKWMGIGYLKPHEKIEFPGMKLRAGEDSDFIGNLMMYAKYEEGNKRVESSNAYMVIKWTLPKSIKTIKKIEFTGFWTVYDKSPVRKTIQEYFSWDYVRSNSNKLKNAPIGLETEISDSMVVSKDEDGIIVTGAEVGKAIKIYNAAGVKVKTVVATDDAVNIKLQKNQMYLVRTGQKSRKVQL